MLLRARIILPVSRAPIESGAILVSGDRIVAMGTWDEIKAQTSETAVDLGNAILLPGLVNAHCHLDYTHMAGMISPPRTFPDWIKSILALKANWTYSDYAMSWIDGAKMLLRTGTTTVADIEAVPELLPDIWTTTPLHIFSFLEMTGVKSDRSTAEILQEVLLKIENVSCANRTLGLSPHALYSTRPELIERSASACVEKKLQMTTHVAESEAEFEMYQHRRGPMYDWLKTQRDTSDCDGFSPVQQLERHGALSSSLLAVHVNYLAPGDAQWLAQRRTNIVHCPRSHAYFCHKKFPYEELAQAGVNICLGTDSLASVLTSRRYPTELNMFTEMQRFSDVNLEVPPSVILKMATINGAKALGLAGEIGVISENARADLIAIPFSGNLFEAEDAVVHFTKNVNASIIAGQWAIPPGN